MPDRGLRPIEMSDIKTRFMHVVRLRYPGSNPLILTLVRRGPKFLVWML